MNQTPLPLSARRPPAPVPARSTVTRLAPADGSDPDPVPVASVQGTLALDLGRRPPEPSFPDLHVVAGGDEPPGGEVRAWAATFAQAVVEVVGGDRPVTQLLRWTTARVYEDLHRRVRILARTAPAPTRMRAVRPQVRSVHVFRPGPASAEVSVHVRHGQRSRALAARLELRSGRWTCVALHLG